MRDLQSEHGHSAIGDPPQDDSGNGSPDHGARGQTAAVWRLAPPRGGTIGSPGRFRWTGCSGPPASILLNGRPPSLNGRRWPTGTSRAAGPALTPPPAPRSAFWHAAVDHLAELRRVRSLQRRCFRLAYKTAFQTGAAAGVSSLCFFGDAGASGCAPLYFAGSSVAYPAVGITGWGETVYNVSVGGTDFEDA